VADYLGAWLDHLCLNALAPTGVTLESTHVARDKVFRFCPVAEPLPLLAELLHSYRSGLSAPLPFYPKTAWALQTGGAGKAMQQWQGVQQWAGEGDDPWWSLALRGEAEPLGEAFAELARRLLLPLLTHLDDPEISRPEEAHP